MADDTVECGVSLERRGEQVGRMPSMIRSDPGSAGGGTDGVPDLKTFNGVQENCDGVKI